MKQESLEKTTMAFGRVDGFSFLATSRQVSRGVAMMSEPVQYLSSLSDKPKQWEEGDDSAPSNPRDQVKTTESVNAGPANYDGFIDAEGFDGGDGQVGVVGDGTNAMEEYDMSEKVRQRRMNAVGGSESKQNRANAWGKSTGYADELKNKGMVDVDEYGEDRLMARRQQLENWRNQRELRLSKEGQMHELYNLQGKEYTPSRHGSYLDAFEQKKEKNPAPSERYTLTPGTRIDDTLSIPARLNQRGGVSLSLRNEYSTYSDFVAGFAPGSSEEISVSPSSGTLNRRSGDPQEFVITFEPQNLKPEYTAKLVIETEDHTWTYDIVGTLQ